MGRVCRVYSLGYLVKFCPTKGSVFTKPLYELKAPSNVWNLIEYLIQINITALRWQPTNQLQWLSGMFGLHHMVALVYILWQGASAITYFWNMSKDLDEAAFSSKDTIIILVISGAVSVAAVYFKVYESSVRMDHIPTHTSLCGAGWLASCTVRR